MRYHGEIPEFKQRYRYLVAAVVLTFLVLVGRLWQLQVVRGAHFSRQTENNFVQEIRIPTVRGMVFDRRGRKLARNRPSFDVYVTPRFVTEASFALLLQELKVAPDLAAALERRVQRVKGRRRYQQILLLRDISRDQLARLETNKAELAGVNVAAVAHREYVHGNLAAHVLGYMNEVSSRDLQRDKEGVYQPGDLVGRYGVERMYEANLRGMVGFERVVVDASGTRRSESVARQLLGKKRRVEPQPGHHLVLTIDLELQRLAERALRRHRSGAAVVMEVKTGRVLASASRPAFDPNVLTGRLSVAEHRRLVGDPHRPLLDKVLRENYFPGSTFKVVTTIAAVEDGLVDWEEKIVCKRFYRKYRVPKRCSHAHGATDLNYALIESCNIFYYTLAERVGLDRIARYARMLGLGASTGLGLNHEVSGFIPTKAWYARKGRRFRVGYTLNAAIGQGDVKVTPIQLVSLYAALANGGRLMLPQIVERIETSDGQVVQSFEPRLRRMLPVRPQTLALMQQSLRGVVEDKDGTAYDARLPSLSVSGKTGTAQVARRGKKSSFWLNDHAWFAAYAPSEDPEVAVVVLVEHGGRAAKVAAPVAMEIFRGYFSFVKPFYQQGAVSRPATGQQGAASQPAAPSARGRGASR